MRKNVIHVFFKCVILCQYSCTVLNNKFAVSRTCFFTGQMREGNSVKKFLNAGFSECFSFGGVGWSAVLLLLLFGWFAFFFLKLFSNAFCIYALDSNSFTNSV